MKNNDEVCHDEEQTLIVYLNDVLMRETKIYHLEHQLPLWHMQLREMNHNYYGR